MPKRKLDAMAGIRGQSGIMNDKEHIRKMRAQLDLAQSLAIVRHAEVEAKRAKKDAAEAGLFDSTPPVPRRSCAAGAVTFPSSSRRRYAPSRSATSPPP